MSKTRNMFVTVAVLTWVAAGIVGIYCGNNFKEHVYDDFNFVLMLAIDYVGFTSGLIYWAIACHLENQEQIISLLYKTNTSDTHSVEAAKIIENADIIYNDDGTKWRCPRCGNLNYANKTQCKSCGFKR